MPKAPRKPPGKTTAGPVFVFKNLQVAPVRKSKICERQEARPTPLAAVLYVNHFYSDEPLPTSSQVPTFSETFRRLKLWDPAKPTGGLPQFAGTIFVRATWRPGFLV